MIHATKPMVCESDLHLSDFLWYSDIPIYQKKPRMYRNGKQTD